MKFVKNNEPTSEAASPQAVYAISVGQIMVLYYICGS
jgi:hypothetical protein